MRITAIEPRPRNPDRVAVHLDDGAAVELAAEVVYAIPLRIGDIVSGRQLHELEARDQAWRAKDSALRLLSFRPRSRREMWRRLRNKGFPEEVVEQCVTELSERGLVDDASFAQNFVRDRLRSRPRGAERLLDELHGKGIDWETARATVNEVWRDAEVCDADLARRAAARWAPRKGETRLRARRRLYNFLARRGFSAEVARQLVAERLP
jgi:regulatory protein